MRLCLSGKRRGCVWDTVTFSIAHAEPYMAHSKVITQPHDSHMIASRRQTRSYYGSRIFRNITGTPQYHSLLLMNHQPIALFLLEKSCIMVISDVDFGVNASCLTKKFIEWRINSCMLCKKLMYYLTLQREKLDNNVCHDLSTCVPGDFQVSETWKPKTVSIIELYM